LTLPSTLTTIGFSAFRGCRGISKAVFFGNAPRKMGDQAYRTIGLRRFPLEYAQKNMGDHVFKDTAEGFLIVCSPESTGFTFPFWKGYPCKRETVEAAGK